MRIIIEVNYVNTVFRWSVLYELAKDKKGYFWNRLPYDDRSFLIPTATPRESCLRKLECKLEFVKSRFDFKEWHLDGNNSKMFIS